MDLRPLIHLWLNKPEVYGGCGYSVAAMRKSVFMGDTPAKSGKTERVWGNDYSMLDVWIDIDKVIRKMDYTDIVILSTYIMNQLEVHGQNWEEWRVLPTRVSMYLNVIAYDILKEGRE